MLFNQPFLHWKNIGKSSVFYHTCAIITLTLIAAMAYWFFYEPVLYSDDWSVVLGRWYYGKMQWFDLAEQRPLLKARFMILYSIFGLNIDAFYGVLWSLNVLNAVLLYALIVKTFPGKTVIAFSIAALVLVYPADLTHMWLIMINIRTVVLLVLLYGYLLLVYADGGHWSALGGALVCLLLTFGMYEGQLGFTMAWSLLLFFVKKSASVRRRFSLLSPLVLTGLFILWRTIGYTFFEIDYADHGNEELFQFSPLVILSRLLRGYGLMLWAWLEPLTNAFGFTGGQAAILLFFTIVLFIFMGYLISRTFRGLAGEYFTQQQYNDQLRRFIFLVLVGTVVIAAGYFPSIAYFRPTIFQLHTRLNIFPLMGASITVVALMAVIVSLINRKQRQINIMMLAGTIPLIFLGTMVQAQVQFDDGVSWEEQKQIWNQFFELAPDLANDTRIVLILSENEEQTPSLNRNGQRLPFAGGWDISTGLNMLYGRTDLGGDLAAAESFSEQGVKAYYGDSVTPYEQVIVLVYDGSPKRLRIVENLAAENLVDTPIPSYKPYEHIINVPTTHIQYRWLVE